jgi:galactose mutarotase-like enzyme
MFTIENENLQIDINAKGAELQSIYHKQTQLQSMWSGDAKFWGKKSPVLFPIVGTLKEDTFYYSNDAYELTRHGFAREMEFAPVSPSKDSITLRLQNTEETLIKFPFDFIFDITYALAANRLIVTYIITNTGIGPMYFAVGGHPAFKVPLVDSNAYNDYYLEFNKLEFAGRWPISKDGLIEAEPLPLLNHTNILLLTKELFAKDALVFKGLSSNSVMLKTNKDKHGLSFDFTGFPYLGIWAAKDADFVCIEPWCGIADSVNTDQQLAHKEGIQLLQPTKNFERSWSVAMF